ncbi:uncharacterized protein BDV14DRAFT_202717 [Aspergillus stella-maris]|uniref:uncharacterized protein n=1 Tax=Aspergillus stella-maris TaxID=1810926 RepID=UPI003CCDF7B7
MAGECSYDCSSLPSKLRSDTDITGLGVVIGYVGAAGIAVTLIMCHYFIAFSPNVDPFRDANGLPPQRDVPFKPNPVDSMILRMLKRNPSSSGSGTAQPSSLDARFTKAILTMSDLQLATGIAILISGYSQLRCGLSAYHWLIAKRQWRLFFMFVLVVMLVTAMVPTASFDDWRPVLPPWELRTTDYAMCLFLSPKLPQSADTLVSTILLVCLIVLGLAFRVIKLYRPLSSLLAESLRWHISRGMRRLLWMLCRSRDHHGVSRRLAGHVFYYPALACFLALRLCADQFSSMFFEVYWLVGSFLVGLFSLLKYLNLLLPDDTYESLFDGGGQTTYRASISVERKQTEKQHTTLQSNNPIPSSDDCLAISFSYNLPADSRVWNTTSTSSALKFDPDYNYYDGTGVMKAAHVVFFIFELGVSGYILALALFGNPVQAARGLNISLVLPPLALVGTILVSLGIDSRFRGKRSKGLVTTLHTVNVVFMIFCTGVLFYVFVAFLAVGF